MEHREVIWSIEETRLRELLRRAASGEDVDMLMLEEYADAEHEEG